MKLSNYQQYLVQQNYRIDKYLDEWNRDRRKFIIEDEDR